MKEALQLGNDKYAGLAAYYHILYYYNRNNQDSVAKWLTIMEPHARKSDLWNYFFDAKRFQIDLYTFNEQYELAINESQKMQQQGPATARKPRGASTKWRSPPSVIASPP